MNGAFQPHPIPWTHFPDECFWYLYPIMGLLHLVVFLVGCIILSIVSISSHQHAGTLKRRIGRFGLFMVLFLFVGAVFNGLWSCLIWDRLYDSTDYVFDFCPFWPITRAVIDAPWGNEHGQLLGVSLFQLQLFWLAFAIGTWSVTIALYRLLSRLGITLNQSLG